MNGMFLGCKSLTTLDVSEWDTSKVTNLGTMFNGCSSLTTLDVSNFNTSNVTNMNGMFNGCSSLTILDVSNWDTSKVRTMSFMFRDCSSLTTLDVSKWNTSNVTTMQQMFYRCSSLTTLDVSNWDTSKVTNLGTMFSGCSKLTTLDVSNWDTSNVTDMSEMFYNCSSLTTLDVSKWNTSNVTNMYSMFSNCSGLTTINVSKWNTSSVTNMQSMFSDCSSLTKLVLCSFDTNKVTDMDYMFEDSSNLKSIYVGPNWTTENATTTDMFTGSGVSEVTQSNTCSFDAVGIDFDISTTSTMNSITIIASSENSDKITKYEYSLNDGNFIDNGNNSTYIFDNLTSDTSYNVKVRITTTDENVLTSENVNVKTKTLDAPIFTDETYNYETTVPIEYTTSSSGEYAWTETNGVWKSGNYHSHNTTSSMTFSFTLDSAQTISFDWSVSSQGDLGIISTDYLYYTIYKNGSAISGTGTDTKISGTGRGSDEATLSYDHVTHTLDPGDYQVIFSYKKDIGPVSSGLDAGYVKNFNAGSFPVQAMGKNVTITYPEGNNLTYEYQINNGQWLTASQIQEINCTESGTIVARVSDGTNAASSSYNIEVGIPPIIENISTTSTTNNINIVTTASAPGGSITKYEYSINDGDYIEGSSTYTFNGLTAGKEYDIKIRVTNDKGLTAEQSQIVSTNTLEIPTFSEVETSNGKDITITYPNGCGSNLICTYIKDNEEPVTVTSSTATVPFTKSGTLIANVTDGTNEMSNVYNVSLLSTMKSWNNNATTDFHNDEYKSKIISAEVVDYVDVPSNAIASWDVSEKQNGGVMAWIIDDPDNTGYYKLYIGGDGGVLANSNSGNLFYEFSTLKSIDLIKLDTRQVTSMSRMFYDCTNLTELDLSNFDTSNVTNMSSMFSYCSSLTTLDLSNFDTSNVTYMAFMFSGCRSLTELDISNFDTSNVIDMCSMFSNCSSLTKLDVSHFDTSKVTDMNHMFTNCENLATLDVSHFNTSSVTDMSHMFYFCTNLTELDVSHFDTSKVTTMDYMFYACNDLTILDVSNFNTSKVTDMSHMFANCENLATLDLSNFDTSNVTTMDYMFFSCHSLTELDLSSFDTSNVISMSSMFELADKLTVIYVGPNWTTENADTTGMFLNSGVSSVTQKS